MPAIHSMPLEVAVFFLLALAFLAVSLIVAVIGLIAKALEWISKPKRRYRRPAMRPEAHLFIDPV